jgi:hypothetical protein
VRSKSGRMDPTQKELGSVGWRFAMPSIRNGDDLVSRWLRSDGNDGEYIRLCDRCDLLRRCVHDAHPHSEIINRDLYGS